MENIGDIGDRISHLVEHYAATAAEFADKVGIKPSAVTHLINKRNKPSFDVLSSILSAFPELNPDWLILGVGEVTRNDENKQTPERTIQPEKKPIKQSSVSYKPTERGLFTTSNLPSNTAPPAALLPDSNIPDPETKHIPDHITANNIMPNSSSEHEESVEDVFSENRAPMPTRPTIIDENAPNKNDSSRPSLLDAGDEIVVLHRDGSFSRFSPRE